jgi:predicted MFS family arabinose efflux permease
MATAVWQSGVVRPFRRLFRLIWGADVDRPLWPVLAVDTVGSLGGGMAWTFIGLWALRKLHTSQGALGTAYLISALVGIVAGYYGGHLSDHVGRKPLIVLSWALQTLLVLAFLAVGGNEKFGLALLCLGGLFWQIGRAADQALIADVVPPERREAAYASVRVGNNLGITIGPPLGGALLALGSWSALFAGSAAISVVTLAIAARFLPSRGLYAAEEPPERGSFGVIVRDRPFVLFLFSSAFAWLVYTSFEVILPISLVESHGFSPSAWGFILIVNPLLVTLFQLRLTNATQGISAATKLLVGLPLMGIPFLLLSVADAVPVVLGILILFVIGEMLWVPSSQSVVARLAPADIRGAYMGAFGGMAAIGFALTPFIGLQVRSAYGDDAVWAMFAVLSVIAGLTGATACRIAAGRPAPGEAAAATSTLGR